MMYKWPSPGKLNLFLYIVGRRNDDYHLVQTLFQFIEYGDEIEIFITKNGEIRVFNLTNHLPYRINLVERAAKLLQYHCCLNKKKMGADIFINKMLPIGSGLGGVSSNAATVLLALNQQWQCGFNQDVLMRLGLMLGADVPVFIYGYTAIGEGIGEILVPIFLPEKWYLIIIPPIYISTQYVFNMYRKSCCFYSPYRSISELFTIPFRNDFEFIIRKSFPEIKIYLELLLQYVPARLTGTGSCIFSEFDNKDFAYRVQSFLPSWITSIITKGVNISPLRRKLL